MNTQQDSQTQPKQLSRNSRTRSTKEKRPLERDKFSTDLRLHRIEHYLSRFPNHLPFLRALTKSFSDKEAQSEGLTASEIPACAERGASVQQRASNLGIYRSLGMFELLPESDLLGRRRWLPTPLFQKAEKAGLFLSGDSKPKDRKPTIKKRARSRRK